MSRPSKPCLTLATLATLGLAATLPSQAQQVPANHVIAYYTFNGGTAGAKVPTTPDGASTSNPVVDDTGHGNNLKTFNSDTGPVYSTNTPTGTGLSLAFTPNQDIYSLGATGGGATGTTLNDHVFTNFTIEASVNFASLGTAGQGSAYQTFLVKDGGSANGVVLFRKWGGTGNQLNSLDVSLMDSTGTSHDLFTDATSATDSFSAFNASTWYNVAVVGDGTTAFVYIQNNATKAYQLQGTLPCAGGLNALNSNWDVGRGWVNGPTDFTNGNVDNVRISDVALTSSQFLFASAPEPSQYAAFGLGVFGLGALALRARKRSAAPAA